MNTEYKLFSNITITKSEIITAIISVFVILIARGTNIFNLTYSVDDYQHTLDNISGSYSFFISQGRFGSVLIYEFLILFGIHPTDSFLFSGILSIVSFVVSGLIVVRLWKVNNCWKQITIILIFYLHPYTSEIFTFNAVKNVLYFNYFLGFIGLYIITNKKLNFISGVILIVFSLSIYQIILNALFTTLLISFILYLIDNSTNKKLFSFNNFKKEKLYFTFLGLIISVFLYLIINKILLLLLHITPIRQDFIGFSDINYRITQIIYLLNWIFFKDQSWFFPIATKYLILIIIIVSFISLIRYFLKNDKPNVFKMILSLILIILTLLSSIGVIIFLKDWYPVARTVSCISIFIGGILAITYKCINNIIIKKVLTGGILLLLFSFIGINNSVFADQIRINRRDAFKANRLITRLEMNPYFSKVKKIYVVSGYSNYRIPIRTMIEYLNMSAYGTEWSKTRIIKEVTGYDFSPLTADDQKKIEKYCTKNKDKIYCDSVEIVDDIGLLWLK
jgi:hypothetical protein